MESGGRHAALGANPETDRLSGASSPSERCVHVRCAYATSRVARRPLNRSALSPTTRRLRARCTRGRRAAASLRRRLGLDSRCVLVALGASRRRRPVLHSHGPHSHILAPVDHLRHVVHPDPSVLDHRGRRSPRRPLMLTLVVTSRCPVPRASRKVAARMRRWPWWLPSAMTSWRAPSPASVAHLESRATRAIPPGPSRHRPGTSREPGSWRPRRHRHLARGTAARVNGAFQADLESVRWELRAPTVLRGPGITITGDRSPLRTADPTRCWDGAARRTQRWCTLPPRHVG